MQNLRNLKSIYLTISEHDLGQQKIVKIKGNVDRFFTRFWANFVNYFHWQKNAMKTMILTISEELLSRQSFSALPCRKISFYDQESDFSRFYPFSTQNNGHPWHFQLRMKLELVSQDTRLNAKEKTQLGINSVGSNSASYNYEAGNSRIKFQNHCSIFHPIMNLILSTRR